MFWGIFLFLSLAITLSDGDVLFYAERVLRLPQESVSARNLLVRSYGSIPDFNVHNAVQVCGDSLVFSRLRLSGGVSPVGFELIVLSREPCRFHTFMRDLCHSLGLYVPPVSSSSPSKAFLLELESLDLVDYGEGLFLYYVQDPYMPLGLDTIDEALSTFFTLDDPHAADVFQECRDPLVFDLSFKVRDVVSVAVKVSAERGHRSDLVASKVFTGDRLTIFLADRSQSVGDTYRYYDYFPKYLNILKTSLRINGRLSLPDETHTVAFTRDASGRLFLNVTLSSLELGDGVEISLRFTEPFWRVQDYDDDFSNGIVYNSGLLVKEVGGKVVDVRYSTNPALRFSCPDKTMSLNAITVTSLLVSLLFRAVVKSLTTNVKYKKGRHQDFNKLTYIVYPQTAGE